MVLSTCLHFHRATAMEGKVGIQNKEWNFGKALTLRLPERWKKYLNKINIQNLLSAKPEKILKEYNQEYYKTRLTEEDTHCHSNDITQTLTVYCHRKSTTFEFIMIPMHPLRASKLIKMMCHILILVLNTSFVITSV